MKTGAAIAAAAIALVASCATSIGPKGSPPSHPELRIAALLQRDLPLHVRARDLMTDSRLRRALVEAGAIRGNHYTAAGLAASRACPYGLTDTGARCFTIARRKLLKLAAYRVRRTEVDSNGAFVFEFTFRALPISTIGKRLAAARALQCADANGKARDWSGSATLAYGSYSASFPENGTSDDLVANCPVDASADPEALIFA